MITQPFHRSSFSVVYLCKFHIQNSCLYHFVLVYPWYKAYWDIWDGRTSRNVYRLLYDMAPSICFNLKWMNLAKALYCVFLFSSLFKIYIPIQKQFVTIGVRLFVQLQPQIYKTSILRVGWVSKRAKPCHILSVNVISKWHSIYI